MARFKIKDVGEYKTADGRKVIINYIGSAGAMVFGEIQEKDKDRQRWNRWGVCVGYCGYRTPPEDDIVDIW